MSTNNILANWVSRREKKAGIASSAGDIINSIWKNKGTIGKGAIIGGAAAATGETLGRTVNNFANDKMTMGTPTSTAQFSGAIADSLLNTPVIGPAPYIANLGRKFGDNFAQSPNVQKIVNALSNITDPDIRNQTFDELGNYISSHTTGITTQLGQGIGRGLFSGMFEDFKRHPILAPAAAVAFTTGPMIAYDLASRKRRREEAERNNAVLRALAEKRGGAVDTLKNSFNFAKNPIRSFVNTTALTGAGVTVADNHYNPERYTKITDVFKNMGHNTLGPTVSMVDGVEGAILRDPGIKENVANSELTKQIQGIIANLKKEPPPLEPEPEVPAAVPWIAGTAALGLPFALYEGYNHLANKKYLKTKKENETLQKQITK